MMGQNLTVKQSNSNEIGQARYRGEIPRKSLRYSVRIRALLYKGETFQPTLIQDISKGGAGIKGAIGITPGDLVSIQFLDGRTISGKVKWWLAGNCGIAFDNGLDYGDPLFAQAFKSLKES